MGGIVFGKSRRHGGKIFLEKISLVFGIAIESYEKEPVEGEQRETNPEPSSPDEYSEKYFRAIFPRDKLQHEDFPP